MEAEIDDAPVSGVPFPVGLRASEQRVEGINRGLPEVESAALGTDDEGEL